MAVNRKKQGKAKRKAVSALPPPQPPASEESDVAFHEGDGYLEPMPEDHTQSYEQSISATESDVLVSASVESSVLYLEPIPEGAPSPEPVAAEEPRISLPVSCQQNGSSKFVTVKASHVNGLDRTLETEIASDSEDVEVVQSETSPYESEAAILLIGSIGKRYTVPADIVNRNPCLKRRLAGLESKTVELPDVHYDVGHTFVHYLYTGDYQTLNRPAGSELSTRAVEYNRSVLVYRAAVSYGLDGLANHAKKHMQLFDDDIPIFHIIVLGRKTFPAITGDSWFATYLTSKIMASFEADEGIFQREEFFEGFGEAVEFDKFLGKVMANAYSQRLSFTQRLVGLEMPHNGPAVMKNGASPASDIIDPAQEARDELHSQPKDQPNTAQESSVVRTPWTHDDMWVDCEDDGNSIQVRLMTPSSSAGGSLEEKHGRQALPRALLQQSKLELDGRICSLWPQHSTQENLWKTCPKCKSHMVSMFAKLLLNDVE